jgi:hypothetical protein
MSILDSVAAKVRARTSKPVTLGHPEILELSVVYRTPTDRTEIQKIKRRADAQKDAGDFDASLLAACCEEISEYGQTVTDDEGQPVTFRDKSLQDKLGAASARDAVRTFYGSDGYVSSTAARLMEAAGWGAFDEVVIEEQDPTSSS